jgi:RHS repeat-associated protein
MEATSGVLEGLLALPDGGGSLRGLGDRFQPDMLKGTGNYSVPIAVPKGPNELAPGLSLRYSTGQGNGPFGMGWRLGGATEIRRRTDRGVPRYDDAADEFVLSEAETLVPVGGGRFRPRSDTRFLDVRRDGDGWALRTKDGRGSTLGAQAAARVADGPRVVAWLLEQETDQAGNAITYSWLRDEGQLYLEQVAWGIWSLRFIYEARPDAVHDGRAGFTLRTALRCAGIERHCDRLAQPVLARYALTYTEAEDSQLSLLTEVRLTGIGEDGSEEVAPLLRLEYSSHRPGSERYLRAKATGLPPPPLHAPGTALVDMDGDGLPDVLQTDLGGHRYWPNRGDASFGSARRLPLAPARMQLGQRGVSFADLNGDGTADLFRVDTRLGLAVANTGAGRWADRPMVYRQQLPLRLSDTQTRLVDLDGDGVIDLLQSGPSGFALTYNRGAEGWSAPRGVNRIADADAFPDVDLGQAGVHLADMTGDGLEDIVYAASGRVEYWPSYGRGAWGRRVRMNRAPVFPAGFDPERVFLSDLDGDGTADIVYVDFDRVFYWLNRSGTGWSERHEVGFVPPPALASLHFADLLGTGTRGLLWSSEDRLADPPGYRFLELMPDKPYLLTRIDAGLGGVTEISYSTSTAMRVSDEQAGSPWDTYLPFPVHVVSELSQTDLVTGRIARTSFHYQRGHYDGVEREFRGFERVTMRTAGDDHSPAIVQRTLFQQAGGAPADAPGPPEERARQRALAGSPLEVTTFEETPDGSLLPHQSAALTWEARLEFSDEHRFVHFPRTVRTEARDHAAGEPDRIDLAEYEYDAFGNLTVKRRTGRFEGETDDAALVTEQRLAYTGNEAAWLVGLPTSIETRDRNGLLLAHTEHRYDGPAFDGLPPGQVTHGLLRKTRELKLTDDALPDGYADGIDPSWGYTHEDGAFYATTVAYDHDGKGNVVGQRDGLGVTSRVVYDPEGQFPVRLEGPDGQLSEATFDQRTAQPAEVRSPGAVLTRYRYSPLGRLKAQFDTAPDGSLQLTQVFLADHGAFDGPSIRPARIASVRPMSAGRTVDEFDDADTVAQLAALGGVSVACDHYDGDGNLLQRVGRGPDAPDGSARWICARRRDYSVSGRRAAEYPNEFVDSPGYHAGAPAGPPARFFYAAGGQVRRIENPDGGRLAVRYLLSRVEKLDAMMADDAAPMIEQYDAWGRLIGTVQPIGSGEETTSAYAVDTLGRSTEIRDGSGRLLITSTFAGPGPAVRIVHADAGERTYWRDAAGKLRQRTDSLGRRVRMDYDDHGRLTTVTDATDPAQPQVVRSLSFEGPRLVEAHEGAVVTRFEYDAAGRPIEKTVDLGAGDPLRVERIFDLRGELQTVVYPDGTRIDYSYDISGSLRGADGFVDGVEYDAHGAPVRIEFTGGPFARFEHEPRMRRLQEASLEGPAGLVRRIQLTHDRNGNVVALHDTLPGDELTRTFRYDGVYRLTGAALHQGGPAAAVIRDDQYAYTPTGDLTRNDESMSTPMTYGDPGHTGRLTEIRPTAAAGPSTVSYDAAGRTTALGQLTNLTYDLWDRLTAATLADGTTVEFAYDHDGNRVRKRVTEPGATPSETRYLENLYEVAPGRVRLHVYLGRLLIATRTVPSGGAESTAFVLTDHLGSALAACDPAGAPVHQQIYSPFGLSLRPAAELDGYTGVPGDIELGLVRLGARQYAPALGRFITPDWFIAENPNRALRLPQALNAYAYAINNPLAFRDPSGLWFGLDDLIVAAVGFVVGFIAGTIYGLATGHSLGDSLLRGLEAGLVGAVGAWLAWNTAGLALGLLGVSTSGGVGFGIMVSAAVIGGLNGTISGMTRIYDWASPTGWFAFLADSTWGLIGTGMGDLVHIVNLFYSDRNYRPELSERQNRHVYDGGFGFGKYAFTQGNVTSNLNGRRGDLVDHETLHIWQNRLFGPIFTVTYVAWMVVGTIVGFSIGLFTDQPLGDDIRDVAYLDNPWESWAYDVGGSAKGGELSWA